MSLLFSTGVIAGSAAKGAPGMVLLKPTSIANTSGSATLGTNGQVTFSAITILNINGVFSADYINYVVQFNAVGSNNMTTHIRLRASGTDASGASDYVFQRIESQTAVVGSRTTASLGTVNNNFNTYGGTTIYFYQPFLAEKTAFRCTANFGTTNGGGVLDHANTHQLTTSYDGFSLLPNGGYNITGNLAVYGVKQ